MAYPDHTALHLLVDIWAVPKSRAYLLRHPAPVLALMERIRRSVDMELLGKPFASRKPTWGTEGPCYWTGPTPTKNPAEMVVGTMIW